MAEEFDYQRYLASREWALKKKAVRERSYGRCERCFWGDHQVTHHLTYERIGREDLEDLLGICRPCHAYLSGESDRDPFCEQVADTRSFWEAMEADYGITLLNWRDALRSVDMGLGSGDQVLLFEIAEFCTLTLVRTAIREGWRAA